MSRARRRGLLRLAALVGVVLLFVILAARALLSGGSSSKPTAPVVGPAQTAPARLRANVSPLRLPEPLHGATAAPAGGGLLVIGGADRNDVSTDRVLLLDPSTTSVKGAGSLVEPLHDAAAATIGNRTLVFGGGASTTFDTVQALSSGAAASVVGHLPTPASDLSAAEAGDVAYVAGGYDGSTPVGTILRVATDGRPTRVGTLPTPVRYTALAAVGGRLYAFGGELADGSDTDLIQRYDPATHRASIVGRLAQAVSHASAVALHGTIYLLGGRRDGAASAQILRFDPSLGRTSRAGRLPSAVFDAAAAVTSGIGYLAGGIGPEGTSLATVLVVRP